MQDLYKSKYWAALSNASALKISITVRTGDAAFQGEAEYSDSVRDKMLSDFHGYFDCASKIEDAFSLRQQKVIWLLNSDSLLLRRSAYEVFGSSKVLTDLDRKPVHPDCRYHNPEECETEAQNAAMVHAMGQLFTSSMADYHISAKESGFGRLAAWMSGRWDNMYELDFGASCDPHHPTSVADSAVTWAGV